MAHALNIDGSTKRVLKGFLQSALGFHWFLFYVELGFQVLGILELCSVLSKDISSRGFIFCR